MAEDGDPAADPADDEAASEDVSSVETGDAERENAEMGDAERESVELGETEMGSEESGDVETGNVDTPLTCATCGSAIDPSAWHPVRTWTDDDGEFHLADFCSEECRDAHDEA